MTRTKPLKESYTKQEYANLERQKKKGWALYYAQLNENYDLIDEFRESIGYDNRNNQLTPYENIPIHISREFYEMAEKLNKKFTCPCCLDFVEKNEFQITGCGHIYCTECLTEIKARPVIPLCAICRKPIK